MKSKFYKLNLQETQLCHSKPYPLKSYKKPTNEKTGKEFPFCCENHKETYLRIKNWFEKFPNCCEEHKKWSRKSFFKTSRYIRLPERIMDQISFTDVGLSFYLGYIQAYLKSEKVIPDENKRKLLLQFISSITGSKANKKERKPSNNTNLNDLYNIYESWLNEFPFEISFLNHLQEKFENELPFGKSKPSFNRYSKLLKYQLHTTESFTYYLSKLSNTLLTELNTLSLYENNKLSDPKKIELELLVVKRKKAISHGFLSDSNLKNEPFQSITKKWLKEEIEFIREIKPLVDLRPTENENNKDVPTTKSIIIDEFNTLPKGWKYAFSSKQDFETFVNLLISFFEHKEYSLPKNTIKLKRSTKTKFAKSLGFFHKELSEIPLASDLKFIEIVKCLNHFQEETNIPKVLSR